MESDRYFSDRAIAEAERRRRVEIFDEFVDLALDGVITMEQAFTGYIEETVTLAPDHKAA